MSSDSPRRIRPVSTCSERTRSGPTASMQTCSATSESTPPDTSRKSVASPAAARVRSTTRRRMSSGAHGVRMRHVVRKFFRIALPCGVCTTSGWNCTPKMGRPSAS